MENNRGFYKQYGTEKESNTLIAASTNNYILFYGYGTDGVAGYQWRKNYDHKPSIEEIREDIEELIDNIVSEDILTGFEYEGTKVWLSVENQLNFRSTPTVPVRFKIGEDDEGRPVYHTFSTKAELTAFNKAVSDHIKTCLNNGWDTKDLIDYTIYEEGLQ